MWRHGEEPKTEAELQAWAAAERRRQGPAADLAIRQAVTLWRSRRGAGRPPPPTYKDLTVDDLREPSKPTVRRSLRPQPAPQEQAPKHPEPVEEELLDGEPDWRTSLVRWCAWMVRKFQDSLPEEQQRRCIAVGIMTDEDGQNPERVWAISGMRSIIDESVMELKPGMEPVSDPTEQFEFVHAEIRLLQEAERQKKRLRVVAAGRLICDECVDQLDKLEVRIVTQPLHPYRPRPHKKVPSLPPITHPTQQKPGTSNVEFPPSDTPKIINPETTRKKKNDPSQ